MSCLAGPCDRPTGRCSSLCTVQLPVQALAAAAGSGDSSAPGRLMAVLLTSFAQLFSRHCLGGVYAFIGTDYTCGMAPLSDSATIYVATNRRQYSALSEVGLIAMPTNKRSRRLLAYIWLVSPSLSWSCGDASATTTRALHRLCCLPSQPPRP